MPKQDSLEVMFPIPSRCEQESFKGKVIIHFLLGILGKISTITSDRPLAFVEGCFEALKSAVRATLACPPCSVSVPLLEYQRSAHTDQAMIICDRPSDLCYHEAGLVAPSAGGNNLREVKLTVVTAGVRTDHEGHVHPVMGGTMAADSP